MRMTPQPNTRQAAGDGGGGGRGHRPHKAVGGDLACIEHPHPAALTVVGTEGQEGGGARLEHATGRGACPRSDLAAIEPLLVQLACAGRRRRALTGVALNTFLPRAAKHPRGRGLTLRRSDAVPCRAGCTTVTVCSGPAAGAAASGHAQFFGACRCRWALRRAHPMASCTYSD